MHCSWSAVEILYYLWQKMPFLSVISCYTLSQQPVKEFAQDLLLFWAALPVFSTFTELVERKIYTAEKDPSVEQGGNCILEQRRFWVMLSSVSCEARKFMTLSKLKLCPPKLSDHIIVAISFAHFFPWSGSSHDTCQLSLVISASSWIPSSWDWACFIFTIHISRIK